MSINKIITYVFFVLFLSSCSKKTNPSTPVNKQSPDSTFTIDKKLTEATVIDYREVDGCRFLLELTTKEKLQPENLPVEFQKDKIKVLVKYHVTNKMTTCMAGKTVYIDFIKIKNE